MKKQGLVLNAFTGSGGMTTDIAYSLDEFKFHGLHDNVAIGTASDRYAGWIGQIYSEGRYVGRTSKRRNTVGGETFVEEVLPVDSVEEYFEHFTVLEIDFTFYRPLLEQDGAPSQNHHVLTRYSRHLKAGDRLVLKAPQLICAQKLRRGGQYVQNESYLNAEVFKQQFYEPAVGILGDALGGFVFEQEYQRKQDRTTAKETAGALRVFFESIPRDPRYHLELRTESYLSDPVFEVLEKYGIGQVLSHWTWLPPLQKQFAKAGQRFFNSGGQCIIRLMTPIGMRYEEAYAKAHPFDQMVEGMMQPGMVEDTATLMCEATGRGIGMNVIINNRAGGNAPMIARNIAVRFLEMNRPES